MAVSPDGGVVALSGRTPRASTDLIEIVTVTSGETLQLLESPLQTWDIKFSPDGTMLAAAGGDHSAKMSGNEVGPPGQISVWNWRTGELAHALKSSYPLYGVEYSPDGKSIAAAGGMYFLNNVAPNPGEVLVWDAASGERVWAFSPLPFCVFNVAFSPDGTRLISGSGKSGGRRPVELKLWNMDTGSEMLSIAGASSSVYKSIFTPDGRQIFAVCHGGKLLVFDSSPVGKKVYFRSPDAGLSNSAADR